MNYSIEHNRKFVALLAFALLLAVPFAFAQAPNLEAMDIVTRSVPDGPVARVGKESIDRVDFLMLYQSEIARFAARNSREDVSDGNRVRLALMCLNSLIEQELLHLYALTQNVTVSADDVTGRTEEQLVVMRKSIAEQAGHEVTDEEIFERLGYASRQEVDEEVKRMLIVAKVREQIVTEHVANLSPEELDRIYQKNMDKFAQPDMTHLLQIFVRANMIDEVSKAQAKKRADEALDAIFSGQRFEAVAKDFSDLPNQVDMGFVPVDRIPDFLREAMVSMVIEDVSDVIESNEGFHIILLVAQKGGQKLTKEQAEGTIRQQMVMQQGGSVIRDFCAELMSEGVEVQVFLELEQNLARINGGKPLDSL
ncbi:MAG: peptidyl-prolyl cis-trans isomerase [Candidatus Hydrogenedentota bacterium]